MKQSKHTSGWIVGENKAVRRHQITGVEVSLRFAPAGMAWLDVRGMASYLYPTVATAREDMNAILFGNDTVQLRALTKADTKLALRFDDERQAAERNAATFAASVSTIDTPRTHPTQ